MEMLLLMRKSGITVCTQGLGCLILCQGVTNVLKHFKEAHYLKEERNQPESGYQQHVCAYIENNEGLCLY